MEKSSVFYWLITNSSPRDNELPWTHSTTPTRSTAGIKTRRKRWTVVQESTISGKPSMAGVPTGRNRVSSLSKVFQSEKKQKEAVRQTIHTYGWRKHGSETGTFIFFIINLAKFSLGGALLQCYVVFLLSLLSKKVA